MDSFGDKKKKKSEFLVESLEDDDHISLGGEQSEFCFWKLKNMDFYYKDIKFFRHNHGYWEDQHAWFLF